MLKIIDAASFDRAIASPISPEIRRLLILRRDQLLTDTGGAYQMCHGPRDQQAYAVLQVSFA